MNINLELPERNYLLRKREKWGHFQKRKKKVRMFNVTDPQKEILKEQALRKRI